MNKSTKSKLRSVAKSLKSTAERVERLDEHCLNWINRAAQERSGGLGGRTGGMAPPVFPDFDRLKALSKELGSAETLLNEAAALVPRQRPKWRRRARRDRLVRLALELTPVFENLTKRRATVDNWPESKSLGPWPEFYARVVKLALGTKNIRDLRGILTEANAARQSPLRAAK